MMDRRTYICILCRFTSKWPGSCPLCTEAFRGMYGFRPPRKHDDRGWKKVEITVTIQDSNIMMCTWNCCVPLRREKKELTLSQYKARVRSMRTHRQGDVPQYSSFKGNGM